MKVENPYRKAHEEPEAQREMEAIRARIYGPTPLPPEEWDRLRRRLEWLEYGHR